MKNSQLNKNRMIGAVVISSALVCTIAWISPSFSLPAKSTLADGGVANTKITTTATAQPVKKAEPANAAAEETLLIQQLGNDGLIDQVTGFVIEKQQDKLFVNGQLLSDDVAAKYISTLKTAEIRVQVFSFMQRLKQHPDASFMQLLFPVSLESPCVDRRVKSKDGC